MAKKKPVSKKRTSSSKAKSVKKKSAAKKKEKAPDKTSATRRLTEDWSTIPGRPEMSWRKSAEMLRDGIERSAGPLYYDLKITVT